MATTRKTDDETRRAVDLLGGRRVFVRRISDASDMQGELRRGFPYAAFESLSSALDVRSADLAGLLGVAARTLARRKTSGQLSPTESDRLYRVVFVTLRATEVLGSLEKAKSWLHKENRALGGGSPISVLDTEIGERQVEDLLTRIEHGIHS